MADMEFIRQVEAIGRWEYETGVPEDERLTRWFPGFNVYTVLMGVEIDQVRQRYMEISQEA